MQRRLVRMQDIAEEVGVSPATVSLVLNNKATALRISSVVQTSVWEAAQRMGYRPNLSARRLRSSSPASLTIALVSPREAPLALLSAVFRGVLHYAAASPVPLQIMVESFAFGCLCDLSGLYDGLRFNGAIIANTSHADDAFLARQELPLPVVLFARHMDNRSYVDATNYRSGREAAAHLLARGRRRLCVLSCAVTTQARDERRRGFLDALRDAGQPAPREAIAPTFDEHGGCRAMAACLADGRDCDGVFTLYDYMAFGAMRALRQAGRRIPADVAVVGHDDADMASFVEPPLTTFHMPLEEMARTAAAGLVDILIGEKTEPVQQVFETTLVLRESA